MNLALRNKKGAMVDDETISWILWIAVLVAVGFGIKIIVSKFSS
jgi:hypothetical protein